MLLEAEHQRTLVTWQCLHDGGSLMVRGQWRKLKGGLPIERALVG